ncbi:hypothetical protein TNCV_741421 [Trichonephila clavipes]|nr:hypothetical protein TNCV_741421 [Trichonephila clavipes]
MKASLSIKKEIIASLPPAPLKRSQDFIPISYNRQRLCQRRRRFCATVSNMIPQTYCTNKRLLSYQFLSRILEPSTTKDPPCSAVMHVKSVES